MTANSFESQRKKATIAVVAMLAAAITTILVLSAAGCSRRSSDGSTDNSCTPAPPAGQPEPASQPVPADAGTEPPPKPVLSLSANDTTECQIAPGWPITFMMVLSHPARFGVARGVPDVVFGSAEKPWLDSLQLEVRNSEGKPVSPADWPMTLVRSEPEGRLELSSRAPDVTARAMWRLVPKDSAKLAQGTYTVCAVLTTGPDQRLESRPVTVQIAPEPAQLSADDKARKCYLLAHDAIDRKDWTAASVQIEGLLADQPDDIGGLELKGDLMAAQGKPQEALAAYNAAVAAFAKGAKGPYVEPSRALMVKQGAIIEQIMKQQGNGAQTRP